MKKLISLFLLLLYSLFPSCSATPSVTVYPADEFPFSDTGSSLRTTTDEEEINKAADTLKELGFTEITDEMIASMHETYNESYYTEWDKGDVMISLLSYLGMGDYDFDTWEWTPSSGQVYAFDMEVLDVGNMYSNFFKGITAINNNEFEITDIKENISLGNEESGIGVKNVTFLYNGVSCQFHAKVMYDWFDGGIISYMNKVFEKEKNPKRLYCMTDGYQGLIIFYCSEEWAAEFTAATGFTLDKS